ncbi:MAG TPA: metallophosphoesterase, partial [Candidatus Binatia bacterium]|nr:metallophosphoesterase [Candidatus Binatia bacterium]
YYAFATNHYTDLFLMLGDNAYHGGGDNVWQVSVFNTYSNLLRQTPVWSTIGNQETGNSATAPPTTYLQNFTFPTNGEAGGVPSGTERYYSFDFGNVHFVCLDSMSSARTTGSPMLLWLEEDLRQNTNEWLIAFFHHPPYSKGSNDSDTRQEQIQMRTNAVPILETYGVDLVLSGHSHSYERSYLIDGHYGFSSTFSNTMVVDSGDGALDGNGAYQKPLLGKSAHAGAVYVVAGSGAQASGGALNHPAMFRSLNQLGSMVLDIHANRLDGKFLRETGAIEDDFTILKGVSQPRLTARFANGTATVVWNSVADFEYRVEFTATLPATSWTDVTGPIIATNVTASWSGPASPGFYRLRSEH